MISKENTVYIVSGYARSGTSMMMEALDNGGIEAVSRESFDNSSRINHEYRVQTGKIDRDYVVTKGSSFYQLEPYDTEPIEFPNNFRGMLIKLQLAGECRLAVTPKMKIVFMRRNYHDIKKSLKNAFGEDMKMSESEFEIRVKTNIDILCNRKDTDVTILNFKDVIHQPLVEFQKLVDNGWPIDIYKASTIIDPTFYRYNGENNVIS